MQQLTGDPCNGSDSLLLEKLRSGDTVWFRAHGNSMWPLFSSPTLFQIIWVAPVSLRFGDIVLCYRHPSRSISHPKWVLHRLLKKVNNKNLSDKKLMGHQPIALLTKGDSCLSADPLWLPNAVVGKIIGFKQGGNVISLTTPIPRLTGLILGLGGRILLKGRGIMDVLSLPFTG